MATIALFLAPASAYTLIYIAAVLLVLETNIFMLWDYGVGWPTWRSAITFASSMACLEALFLERLSPGQWVVFIEGAVLAMIGEAFLLRWPEFRRSVPLATVGTLTLAMAVFDFVYLMNPAWQAANGWAPSLMCTIAFCVIGWHGSFGKWHSRREVASG